MTRQLISQKRYLSANNSLQDEMKIKISLHLPWKRKVKTCALIDSRARELSFIDENFVTKNHIPSKPLDQPIPVWNVDGTENQVGDITIHVDVPVEIKGLIKRILLLVTFLGWETVMLVAKDGKPEHWLGETNPGMEKERHLYPTQSSYTNREPRTRHLLHQRNTHRSSKRRLDEDTHVPLSAFRSRWRKSKN